MFTIQFIDRKTGNNIDGGAAREWPALPRVGDSLILFLQPIRQFNVVQATWIDAKKESGKLMARLIVEEVA